MAKSQFRVEQIEQVNLAKAAILFAQGAISAEKLVANVTDETGEVDSQKVTLVATGNKNGNYEISLPETISNVYVSNYKTLNGDKSANDKIVLSQDEVENKEINLEVNYDKKNVTSTKTNEEMTLYKQNLEYDDKGIYVEGYLSQTRNL